MKRCYQWLGVVVGVGYAARFVWHQSVRSVALPVVAEVGGKVGSITAPLGGTEYVISFVGCTLTRKDIDRLVVFNELARNGNSVSISLDGASISLEDRQYLQKKLPKVQVWPGRSKTD